MKQWISVFDRLPAPGTDVYVMTSSGVLGFDHFGPAHDAEDPSEFCVYGDDVIEWTLIYEEPPK